MAQNTINGFEYLGTALQTLLMADSIQPGAQPGYELCREIYLNHPHGAKLTDFPISMAQHKPRKITIPKAPDDGEMLVEAFLTEWKNVHADLNIFNTGRLARVYGVSTLGAVVKDDNSAIELDFKKLDKATVSFNVWDPLNTAGSLVLSQDPNALDYQKPAGVSVNGQPYHRSRVCVLMNEAPIYIAYQSSGFGFVGRSVYQRGLMPLKSFVMTMATDMMIALKAGVLVAKMQMQSSAVDGIMSRMLGKKREIVKEAQIGNVINIGVDEDIESLNMQNLEGPYELARKNIIENEAAACGTPAKIVLAETYAEGFGEGTEDAKAVAQFIESIRSWLDPLYTFMDQIVQYRAWNEDFYATVQSRYPDEYAGVSYAAAFNEWRNSFTATWPNLLDEPESEKIKTSDVKLKAIISWVEVATPMLDPENKARLVEWASNNMNEMKNLFTSPLTLDIDAIADYEPPVPEVEPNEPKPEGISDSSPSVGKRRVEVLDKIDALIRSDATRLASIK